MSAKQDAKSKITTAEKACSKVQADWVAADKALSGGVNVNGYGIYSDRFELRNKLELARRHITEALVTLDGIDWPSNAEYDSL